MKAPKGIEDMAERLRTAATTPALTVVQAPAAPAAKAGPVIAKPTASRSAVPAPAPAKRVKGAGTAVAVFLSVPEEKHAELKAEAVRQTKQTGKGVSVQQIILSKL